MDIILADVGGAGAISPPASIAEIDAAWVTRALAVGYPGVEVTSLVIGTVIHGTATKVRLLLTYNEAGHRHRLPPTMWLKAGFEAHSQQQIEIYAGEACFYRDLAEPLGLGCARAFFCQADPSWNGSALLLEDLLAVNATFGDARRPVTPDAAARVLDLHARLHASHWTGESLGAYAWLSDGGALLRSGVIGLIFEPASWDRCMALPRGAFVPKVLRDREHLRAAMFRMLEFDRDHAHCLVHGDAHLGNTFWLPDGRPGYLDWQTAMRGYWAHDVADFITTALTIEDRRHAEKDLIAHYVASLVRQGVTRLSFEEAWREYRAHALYNFGWAICLPEWQPDEICAPNAERACAAVVELDSLAAW